MKKTLKIRLTLFFITVNCIAFGVNLFGISPKIEAVAANQTFEVFFLTDSKISEKPPMHQVGYLTQSLDGFWPFEAFYINTSSSPKMYTAKFRGFFAGFEFTEFIFYNSLILGLLLFLRFW